jgi:hypothetical protein
VLRKTRLGKVVGSVSTPLRQWTYWKESGKWHAVAPSGAKMASFDNELDAKSYAATQNRQDENV